MSDAHMMLLIIVIAIINLICVGMWTYRIMTQLVDSQRELERRLDRALELILYAQRPKGQVNTDK